MARPAGVDAAVTRQRILESALTLFGERGLDGVSIREIGKQAGVTLATVHHHFGTKDELHSAVIDAMHERIGPLVASLAAKFAGPGDRDEKIGAALREAFRFARAHRSAIQLLLRMVVETGDIGDRRARSVQAPFLEFGARMFADEGDEVALARARIRIQHIVFLLARSAVASHRELRILSGVDDPERAMRMVEDVLVDTAIATLARS